MYAHVPHGQQLAGVAAVQILDAEPRDPAGADAKPTFIRPYTGVGHPDPSTLPLLLYVPGIDGTGMAASRQFPELVQAFDLRAFSVPISDRTPFEGLVDLLE